MMLKQLEASQSDLETHQLIHEECIQDLQEELKAHDFDPCHANVLKECLNEAFEDLKCCYASVLSCSSVSERDELLLEKRKYMKSYLGVHRAYCKKTLSPSPSSLHHVDQDSESQNEYRVALIKTTGDKDTVEEKEVVKDRRFQGFTTDFSSWLHCFMSELARNGITDSFEKLKKLRSSLRGVSLATISSVSDDEFEKAIQLLQVAFAPKNALEEYSGVKSTAAEKNIENQGLQTHWYTFDEYDELLRRLKFGDLIQVQCFITSLWMIYVGDEFGKRGEHMVFFINGDRFFNLFSSSRNTKAWSIPLKEALKSRKARINNELDRRIPPSSFTIIRRKIENELEELDWTYNYFSESDEKFAKYIRNDQKNISTLRKVMGELADNVLTPLFGKLALTLESGFKMLMWK